MSKLVDVEDGSKLALGVDERGSPSFGRQSEEDKSVIDGGAAEGYIVD